MPCGALGARLMLMCRAMGEQGGMVRSGTYLWGLRHPILCCVGRTTVVWFRCSPCSALGVAQWQGRDTRASISDLWGRVGVRSGNSGATLWANLVSLHIGASSNFPWWLISFG